MTRHKAPNAPPHLSADMRRWWQQVTSDYELEPHHLRLLQTACEAWDRMQQARRKLAADGLVILDRFKQPRTHPAVAIERDARLAFARLIRELALDTDVPEAPRPPRGREYRSTTRRS